VANGWRAARTHRTFRAMSWPVPALVLLLTLLTWAGACAPETSTDEVLRISAAASLGDVFGELARTFEGARPGTRVELNLGGSARLATQILEGAPVDVLASANRAVMDGVQAAGRLLDEPRVFARNHLVLAVPAGNPGRVEDLADLGREDLLVGLCAPTVPCGALAHRLLRGAGVAAAPDTEEPDVRALLTKLELGELDAGLVYATDAQAAGASVEVVPVPEASGLTTEYVVAGVADTAHPEAARAFAGYLISGAGQTALRRHGFGHP